MKRCLNLIVAIGVAMGAMGEMKVSQEEAQDVALRYYQEITDNPEGDYTVGIPEPFSLQGLADMWLLPINDTWILVSSDKRTEAILARFDTKEKPDLKSYPPAAQYLISCCEYDIAYVRDNCKECQMRKSWEKQQQKIVAQTHQAKSLLSVDPLLGSIAWNQCGNASSGPLCSHVYNKCCPSISTTNPNLCNKAVTGCVAIAVGQIMRYWKWPYAADVPITVGGSTKNKKFYNWNLMPPSLSNNSSLDEADMIAGFLRDLGYDMNMNYGESSGTSDDNAFKTFKNYGFDENTLTKRLKSSTPGWTNILHEEIAAGRPVYYGGYDSFWGTGGHAFVLDGYDEGHMYHINMGHGTIGDGYYMIDNVYPYYQIAIWGIQPSPRYCTSATITAVETPRFCIAQEGMVTLNGVQMYSILDGRVFSETGIRLTSGTHIAGNGFVWLAIKPIPCAAPMGPANIAVYNADSDISSIEENKKVQTDLQHLTNIHIYSIDGKLINQFSGGELSTLSLLPNGVYILQASTEAGQLYQEKIIIQH